MFTPRSSVRRLGWLAALALALCGVAVALLWRAGASGAAAWLLGALLALLALLFAGLLHLQRRLREAVVQRQQIMDALPIGLAVWGADDRLIAFNEDFRRLYGALGEALRLGMRFEALLARSVEAGLVPEAAGREAAWMADRMERHRQAGGTLQRRMADGRVRRITEQRLADGTVVSHSVDVTELVQRQQSLEAAQAEAQLARDRLADAIEALPAGFELYDADDRLVIVNGHLKAMYPHIAEISEREPRPTWEEIVRTNHARGGLPDIPDRHALERWIAMRHHERRDARAGSPAPRVVAQPGGRWVSVHARPLRDGGLVGVRVDITELKRREAELSAANEALDRANEELRQLSDSDPLTGLANRRHFDRRIADDCQRSSRHGAPVALLLVDVDHFKRYNDHHGHPAGDEVLREVAALLRRAAARTQDLVARVGGEEFALLLPHTEPDDARGLAETLRDTLAARSLPHGDSPVAPRLTVSIGVAAARGTDAEPRTLLAAADRALYVAKATGRDRVVVAGDAAAATRPAPP